MVLCTYIPVNPFNFLKKYGNHCTPVHKNAFIKYIQLLDTYRRTVITYQEAWHFIFYSFFLLYFGVWGVNGVRNRMEIKYS